MTSLRQLAHAISAASHADDFDVRRVHVATARALHGTLRAELERLGRDVDDLESDLARRAPARTGVPGVAP